MLLLLLLLLLWLLLMMMMMMIIWLGNFSSKVFYENRSAADVQYTVIMQENSRTTDCPIEYTRLNILKPVYTALQNF